MKNNVFYGVVNFNKGMFVNDTNVINNKHFRAKHIVGFNILILSLFFYYLFVMIYVYFILYKKMCI